MLRQIGSIEELLEVARAEIPAGQWVEAEVAGQAEEMGASLESLAFKRPADGGKEALDLLERYDMRSLVPRIEKLWEELDSQNEKS